MILDRAIRSCGKCGQELTVAERMFYFLEATETEPLCRVCLGQEASPVRVAHGAPRPVPPRSAERTLVVPEDSPPAATFEGVLLDTIRFFLAEELRRSGLTIARLPADGAQVRAARDLHNETEWLLQSDRVREAIESLRDLRTLVHLLETSETDRPGILPGSRDEPTIEELYDRVLRRASVLSARLRVDLDANSESLGRPEGLATGAAAGNPSGDLPEATGEPAELPVRELWHRSRA